MRTLFAELHKLSRLSLSWYSHTPSSLSIFCHSLDCPTSFLFLPPWFLFLSSCSSIFSHFHSTLAVPSVSECFFEHFLHTWRLPLFLPSIFTTTATTVSTETFSITRQIPVTRQTKKAKTFLESILCLSPFFKWPFTIDDSHDCRFPFVHNFIVFDEMDKGGGNELTFHAICIFSRPCTKLID